MTLSMEMKPDAELNREQQNEGLVTLDPDTAQPWLILAEEMQSSHDEDVRKRLPDMMLSLSFPTSVEHSGVWRLHSALRKYACELTLDPNTAHKLLSPSEDNRKVGLERTSRILITQRDLTPSSRVSPDGGGSSDTLTQIHTFLSTFTQDLYPGFRLMWSGCSVSLCEL
ncbi:unnamed protein product [Arctogadus glacialis]